MSMTNAKATPSAEQTNRESDSTPTSRKPRGLPLEQRRIRDREFYERYLSGETIRDISETAGRGMNPRRVSEAIDRAARVSLAELTVTCSGLAAQQIEQHRHIYAEAMAAWGRSKEPEMSATVDDGGPRSGPRTKQTKKTRPGEAAFLRVARESLESIRELVVEALDVQSPEIVEDKEWFSGPQISQTTVPPTARKSEAKGA